MGQEEGDGIPHEAEPLKISGFGSKFKLHFARPLNQEEIETLSVDLIKTIEDRLIKSRSKGIGHIKLYIKGTSGHLLSDTLGSKYGVHIERSLSDPEQSVQMTVNTIALGIGRDDIIRITRESIESTSKRYGFLLDEEKSYRNHPPHRV